MEDIQNKIIEIVAKEFKKPIDSITLEKTLAGDLGADSLALVDLIMEIEDAFDVEIVDYTGNRDIATVKDLVDAVSKLVNKKVQA
jgi:acyl carrier protein